MLSIVLQGTVAKKPKESKKAPKEAKKIQFTVKTDSYTQNRFIIAVTDTNHLIFTLKIFLIVTSCLFSSKRPVDLL